jgi:hypothetical protein
MLPKVGGNYKKLYYDYSLAPIDEADANAKQHDLDYDRFNLAGLKGIIDERSTKANEDYIQRANKLIEKLKKGKKDDITGKPVTEKAKDAAVFGKRAFQLAEELKNAKQYKDDKIQEVPVH